MKGRIFVVDDDLGILEGFMAILENAGYQVQTATDAQKLLELTKKMLPDLIILDVLISGIDGRDISKKLKRQKETKHIPIIMISAAPHMEKSVQEALADDFLSKPFEMDELLTMVAKYV